MKALSKQNETFIVHKLQRVGLGIDRDLSQNITSVQPAKSRGDTRFLLPQITCSFLPCPVPELPAGNAVLWLPPPGAGENLSSCPQSPGRCRGAEKQGDTIASCVTAATSCLHQCQLQDLPMPPTAAQKGSGCS